MDPVIAALSHAPLFSALTPGEIAALAAVVRSQAFAPGAVVVEEGGPGDAMFIIASGGVRVSPNSASSAVLAMLGPGEFFGEVALLDGGPRSAAVVADRQTTLLVLGREQVVRLAASHPLIDERLRAAVRERAARGATAADSATVVGTLSSTATATVGRTAPATFILDDPSLAAVHVELEPSATGWVVLDHSGGQTFINGRPVRRSPLGEGDELRIGRVRLFLDRGLLKRFDGPAGVRVESTGVTIRHGRRTTLEDVPVAIAPGELVAIVGPSGAGKTTLLRVLLGMDTPASGEVTYDGLALMGHRDAFRPILGYVPQDDIVHPDLTVGESLSYAARLRLPSDTPVAERAARIDRVLEQLGLASESDSLVRNLSGGQRKRASIAIELLTGPRLLFMDEPTSGLDPARDERMMELFRALADQGRTVVLTTHATRNIHRCDRLIVLSEGRLAFSGSPAEALTYFGVEDFAQIYAQLEAVDASQLSERLLASAAYRHGVEERLLASPAAGVPAARRRWAPGTGHLLRQLLPLALRTFRLARRDRLNMALRLGGPPFLGLALAITFDRSIFEYEAGDGGNALSAVTLLYLISAVTLFLGAFTAANAITAEAAIFRRERLVDLSPTAYVLGKAAVLGAFSVIQSVLMVGTVALFIDLPHELPGPEWRVLLELLAATTLVSLAGMGLGLFVSSLSPNADRAAMLVVILLIPQLIFAGATVPRRDMSPGGRVISNLTVTKWSLELMAGITNLRDREAHQAFAPIVPFPDTPEMLMPIPEDKRPFAAAFRQPLPPKWAVLGGFAVVFLFATLVVQSLKGRDRGRWWRRG
ncbi:MAG: ATP-binding cassette domain-containing protein [Dehalococcoidia bacterium]